MSDRWDAIRAKLDQLEVALGMEHSKAPTSVRLDLIVQTVISQRTALEESRREVLKWRAPTMEAAKALARVYELALSEHRGS